MPVYEPFGFWLVAKYFQFLQMFKSLHYLLHCFITTQILITVTQETTLFYLERFDFAGFIQSSYISQSELISTHIAVDELGIAPQ